jgi:hypothetical protein
MRTVSSSELDSFGGAAGSACREPPAVATADLRADSIVNAYPSTAGSIITARQYVSTGEL